MEATSKVREDIARVRKEFLKVVNRYDLPQDWRNHVYNLMVKAYLKGNMDAIKRTQSDLFNEE